MDRLYGAERMEMRERVQDKAVNEIIELWRSGKRSAIMIRPTGFGKTYTVAKILNIENEFGMKLFKNVLFVYPMNIIKNTLIEDINKINVENSKTGRKLINCDSVKFMSYMAMANVADMPEDKIIEKYSNFDLIIFDEFHRAGAEKASVGCSRVFKASENAKGLGMTATYGRTDGVNQALEVFDEHNIISVYKYQDAVKDGLMPKLAYFDARYYKAYDEKGNLKSKIDFENLSKNEVIEKSISNFGAEIRNSVIKTIGEEGLKTGLRWICFFSTIKDLYKEKNEIEVSFKAAFPDKEIKILTVASNNAQNSNNLELLIQKFDEEGNEIENEWVHPKDNQCIIVLSVDMISMGYHTGNLTGALLFRNTKSTIIFQQQIGRTLSISRDSRPIILDMVGALDSIIINNKIRKLQSKNNKKRYENNDASGIEDNDNYIICADAIDIDCIEVMACSRNHADVIKKIAKIQYENQIDLLIDAVFTIGVTPLDIAMLCEEYAMVPKYVYGIIKDSSEVAVNRTVIETADGKKKLKKVKEQVTIDAEQLERIDKLFKEVV